MTLASRLPFLVDDGIDLVELAVADEHRPLVAEPQRARIGDAAGIDLDLEALGQLELRDRQLVRRRRERRRRDAAQLLGHFGVGNVGTPRHRGRRRLNVGRRFFRSRRRRGISFLRLLRERRSRHKHASDDFSNQKVSQV